MISDPIQTSRAILTWQRPLHAGEPRDRHSVGELIASEEGMRFRYFDDEAIEKAVSLGFEGYSGLPLETYQGEARSENVEPVFMRRLPPVDRADFTRFTALFGLAPEANLTPLSLLAYTGARLTSDSFGIAETFEGFDRPFRYVFDVAGYRRYRDNAEGMVPGDGIRLAHEPDNPHDPNAVQVLRDGGQCLGYINRAQSAAMRTWLDEGDVSASVFRFNGRPDYPRMFIFADVRPSRHVAAAA